MGAIPNHATKSTRVSAGFVGVDDTETNGRGGEGGGLITQQRLFQVREAQFAVGLEYNGCLDLSFVSKVHIRVSE